MKIQIGDKLYDLAFTARSMVHAEMLLDKSFDEILRMTGIRATAILLWCGLLSEQKGLTIEQAADLVEAYSAEHGGWEAGRGMLNIILTNAIAESNFLRAREPEVPTR